MRNTARKISLSLFSLLMLTGACKRELPPSLDAFHVQYRIEYLEDMAGDIPTMLLPKNMEAYYTRNYVYTEIEGFMRQFRLVQIANLRKRQVTTLLSFFGNRVYYTGESGQLPAALIVPDEMEILHTGDTATIGGLLSEQALVTADGIQFPIYFTREFSVRRPNLNTPYQNIEYPLTDFRIQLSKLKMHATCAFLEEEQLESDKLLIPDNYKQVSRAGMEEIINSLFTKE